MKKIRIYITRVAMCVATLAAITVGFEIAASAGTPICIAWNCQHSSDCDSGCPGCVFVADLAEGTCGT